jgi:hypothetical protein
MSGASQTSACTDSASSTVSGNTTAVGASDRLTCQREAANGDTAGARSGGLQALDSALETLLLAVRKAGAEDETEEIIYGVWDRLTGWWRASRRIEPRSDQDN